MIGDMIAKAREEKNMTKAELARLANIDLGHLSHIEKGERNPSHKTLQLICQALEIPYQQLMYTYDKNLSEEQESYGALDHISYDKIIMKPKTFLKTRHVLSRIKRKIDGGYRLNSYDAKRILTYTARARFFDMYNFVSSYDFDRGKLKRIVSHADRLKKLSQ